MGKQPQIVFMDKFLRLEPGNIPARIATVTLGRRGGLHNRGVLRFADLVLSEIIEPALLSTLLVHKGTANTHFGQMFLKVAGRIAHIELVKEKGIFSLADGYRAKRHAHVLRHCYY